MPNGETTTAFPAIEPTTKRFEKGFGVGGGYAETSIPNFRRIYPMYDNRSDAELLKALRKKFNAYYDIPDEKLAKALEKKVAPIIEEIEQEKTELEKPPERRWYNKPIANFPKWLGMVEPRDATMEDIDRLLGPGGLNENVKRAMYGGIYGEYETLNELTTPLNLGLLFGTLGAGIIAKKGYHLARFGSSLTSMIFAVIMGKELPAEYAQLETLIHQAQKDPTLWGEVGRSGAHLLFTGAFAASAAKHGIKEAAAGIGTMRTLKTMGYKPTKRIGFEKIPELQKSFMETKANEAREMARAVGAGKEFHYPDLAEIEARANGLMELGKAKAELDKIGKRTDGLAQGELFDIKRAPESTGQVELFKEYDVTIETPPKMTKVKSGYYNEILEIGKKKGLVDPSNKASFEMIRLLDRFNVDKIENLTTPQMRKMVKTLNDLPANYPDIQVAIGNYYQKINETVFSPDIARKIVDSKDLSNARVPYDQNYDYVYNPAKSTFKKEKIQISSPEDYNYIRKTAKQTLGTEANRFLHDLTDGQLKRFSPEDMKILANRFRKANPNYISEELKDFLSNGMEVYSFNEQFMGDRFDWLKAKYIQSAYNFFEKVGMGQVFRDAVQNKRLTDIRVVNTFNKAIDEAFAPIIKNKLKMKKFSELALEYRDTGMSAFEAYPEYKPIMEKIEAIFKEIGDLSVEHDVQVYNAVTDKNEPFSEHRHPYYQPNIYRPEKIVRLRKNNNQLYEKVKQQTGYTDKRQIDRIVESILRSRKGYRQGNLENVRLVDEPGWLGDPRDVNWKANDIITGYKVYLHSAIDRITSLKYFEGKGTGGVDLYNKYINKMSNVNNKIAMKYMDSIRGMNKKGYYDDWAIMIRNLQLMRKLNLAPIANSMQVTITSLPKYSILGYRRMALDLAKEAFPIVKMMGHNDLATLGIDMAHSMEALVGIQGKNNLNGIARKWLKANMFSTTEFFNRNFSYHIGQRYVRRMVDMLHGKDRLFGENYRKWVTGEGRNYLIKELRKMGVSNRAIDTGILTPADLNKAGYRFSMETQFGTMPENLPFAWSTPWGKVATQFKSFTFSMARFGKENLIKPILKNPNNINSWKPLLTWTAAAQLSGEAATYIRQAALKHILGLERKRPRPDDPMIRGFENMMAISPFGLGWEIWQSLGYGDFWSNVLGPTAGDIEKVATQYIREGKLPVEEAMPYPLNKYVKKQLRE